MNPYELARDPYVIQPGGGSGVTRPPRMGPTPGGGPDPTFAGVTGGPLQAPPIDPGVDLTTVRPGPVGITPQQQALLDQYMNGRRQSALTRRMAQINAANPLLAQMAGRDGAAQIADAPPALDNAMGRGASTMQTNAGDYAPGPSAGTSKLRRQRSQSWRDLWLIQRQQAAGYDQLTEHALWLARPQCHRG